MISCNLSLVWTLLLVSVPIFVGFTFFSLVFLKIPNREFPRTDCTLEIVICDHIDRKYLQDFGNIDAINFNNLGKDGGLVIHESNKDLLVWVFLWVEYLNRSRRFYNIDSTNYQNKAYYLLLCRIYIVSSVCKSSDHSGCLLLTKIHKTRAEFVD